MLRESGWPAVRGFHPLPAGTFRVNIDFPLLALNARMPAEVVAWSPVDEQRRGPAVAGVAAGGRRPARTGVDGHLKAKLAWRRTENPAKPEDDQADQADQAT